MKTAYFTTRFPSVSHPVYLEMHNADGHIIYWNAFTSVQEMRDYMEKLFNGEKINYKHM